MTFSSTARVARRACGWLLMAAAITIAPLSNLRAGHDELASAPEWKLEDLGGKTIRLSDLRGKVVILDFWATWCSPCRKEIPGLNELQKRYGARGLVVIGIALDEEPGLVKTVVRELNVTYPVVYGNPFVAASYGEVSALPTTFIIGRDGKIVAEHEGFTETSSIEREITPLF